MISRLSPSNKRLQLTTSEEIIRSSGRATGSTINGCMASRANSTIVVGVGNDGYVSIKPYR